jgi:hypothetical protein
MAKVIAPLFSFSAVGNVASVLNFKRWGDFHCVRKNTVPKLTLDPHTIKQNFNRQYFSDVVKVWQNLNSTVKSALDIRGDKKQQSGFNFHVRAYFFERPSEAGVLRLGYSELGDLTI